MIRFLRAAALRHARRLVLPELRAAGNLHEARTWDEAMEHLRYLDDLERRHLAEAGQVQELREELAEHLEALEEVRGKLAQAERDNARFIAAAGVWQKRAEELEQRLRDGAVGRPWGGRG